MHVAIDAVGIRGQGGAAVLWELLHWLPRVRPAWRWHVFLLPRHCRDFNDPPSTDNLTVASTSVGHSEVGRLWWVNGELPGRLRELGSDVLLSLANVGSCRPNVAQVVFCQQALAFMPAESTAISPLKRMRMSVLRPLILAGARRSQSVVVQTEVMRDMMIRLEPALSGRVEVIPSGYRTSLGPPKIREEVRQRLEATSRPRLIYLSHPGEHKNHLRLVEALPAIFSAGTSGGLMLTMDPLAGPDESYRRYVRRVQEVAEKSGVAERLTWLGVLTPDEVHYALSQADLHVFPSLAESFGLGLAESIAAECPIAAADLPYAHNVAGESAVYFDPHSKADIARCVVNILQDEPQRQKLIEAAHQRKEKFSYQGIAERFAQVLERAAHERVAMARSPFAIERAAVSSSQVLASTGSASPPANPGDVTVIILTFNEESNLPTALDSLRGWAKEVFVVDSYSTDRTVDIALERAADGVRVVQHPFLNYSAQWNWALTHLPLSGKWTMKMDADECVTPEFREETNRIIASASPDLCGLYFRRKQIFLGRELQWGTIAGNYVLHLWRTGTAKFEDRPVQEHALVQGRTDRLFSAIEHNNHKSLSDWIRKHERYSSLEALSLIEGNMTGEVIPRMRGKPDERRMWMRRLYRSFPFRHVFYFLYRYVIRLGFLDGQPGFTYSFLHSVYLYWIDLKIKEYRLTGKLPEIIWPQRGQPHPVVRDSELQKEVDALGDI